MQAFVRCADYQGIQFVKHLQKLAGRAKQRADVAVYFKRFDEAEQLYHKMDRPDLAVDMRMRLGDWFKVRGREGGMCLCMYIIFVCVKGGCVCICMWCMQARRSVTPLRRASSCL